MVLLRLVSVNFRGIEKKRPKPVCIELIEAFRDDAFLGDALKVVEALVWLASHVLEHLAKRDPLLIELDPVGNAAE